MDLWTSYGTRVLSPFDGTWYAWDVVFIVDPYLLLVLAASVLLARRAGPRLASVGLALALAYVGGRAVLHARAVDAILARVPASGPVVAAALPTPLDPFRWRALADDGAAYWTGEVRLNGRAVRCGAGRRRPRRTRSARVRETSKVGRRLPRLLAFSLAAVSRAPTLAPSSPGPTFASSGRAASRSWPRVTLGPDGRILSETFRF